MTQEESIAKLDKSFDGLNAEIARFLQHHRIIKIQRDELLAALKEAAGAIQDSIKNCMSMDNIKYDIIAQRVARAIADAERTTE